MRNSEKKKHILSEQPSPAGWYSLSLLPPSDRFSHGHTEERHTKKCLALLQKNAANQCWVNKSVPSVFYSHSLPVCLTLRVRAVQITWRSSSSDLLFFYLQGGSTPNLNMNLYATKKTVSEGMLDVALFLANITHMKAVIEQGAGYRYRMCVSERV